jgi:CDP-glucose 4,6-dehydratase
VTAAFWQGRRVFMTGHTGFKGSWLALWLSSLGARVTGFSLDPPTEPSLCREAGVEGLVHSVRADVRDRQAVALELRRAEPDVVFHLAAQSLVRESYRTPVETFEVNLLGTVHLLEAVRACPGVQAVVVVTSDKCYENREWVWGYRESDPLGGFDPYSSSKACAELAAAAYRNSFFPHDRHRGHGGHRVAMATVRAGNVIGGGDWAADRIVPDCIRAFALGEPIAVRNPGALRPWQHVLDPLHGYLALAERLVVEGPQLAGAWNFGPDDADVRPVASLVEALCRHWGDGASCRIDAGSHPHEARFLKLDCSRAHTLLGWRPLWDLETAVARTVSWARGRLGGADVRGLCLDQINEYGTALARRDAVAAFPAAGPQPA